jgi:hypothetical protein
MRRWRQASAHSQLSTANSPGTVGFDTGDLIDAKALLMELG